MRFFKNTFVSVMVSSLVLGISIASPVQAAVPGISSTSPENRATGVALNANIVITFSEAVSAESGQINIYKASDNSLFESIRVADSSKVSLNSAVVTINPAGSFAYNTRYYVLIDDTAFDSVADDQSFGGIQSEGTLFFTTLLDPASTTTSTTTSTVAATTTIALPRLGGTKCLVAGRTRTVAGVKFVCKKTVRLVWRRA